MKEVQEVFVEENTLIRVLHGIVGCRYMAVFHI